MAFYGEEVEDPFEGLVGVVGVKRGKTQMAGFRKGNGVSIVSASLSRR